MSIAASRIADVTRIPRQTVRRKRDIMRARGWVEQCPDQGWRLTIKDGRCVATTDLGALDARGIDRAWRLAAAFARRL